MRRTVVVRCLLALVLLALPACGDAVPPSDGPPPAASDTSTADLALAPEPCPSTVPAPRGVVPGVPAPPTTETDGRLVPDADPVSALVCRYEDRETGGTALVGQVELTGGLDRVRTDLLVPRLLDGATRSCTAMGGPVVPHLVRFSYADGDLWVSATTDPNSCVDSGNGDFTTGAYLGEQVSASFDAGRWVPYAPPADGCSAGGRGRAGQDRTLVPDGWTSLALCRPSPTAAPPVPRALDQATAERVAALLADVPTAPGSGGCSGPSRTTYDLLVTYPDGPPVQVRYAPGCEPPVRNGSLDATPTAAQGAALEELLRAP